MPEISVIVPIYNVAKYLHECLNSICSQTFKDIEIVCVNDGSTDDSTLILSEFARKDPRIKVISQKNCGVSAARNNGLKNVSGKYIYFCDSDDVLHPECLEISHYFAQKYDADLVSFGFSKNENKNIIKNHLDPENIEHRITENPILDSSNNKKFRIIFNVWTKLYKKELLDGIKFIENIKFEDYPFIFDVLTRKPKTVVLNQSLYFYTINNESLSHSKESVKNIRDYRAGINSILDICYTKKLNRELDFLKHTILPDLLKQQYNRCRRADNDVKAEMFAEFINELKELKKKGFLVWQGHKLSRYIKYLWLTRKGCRL